MRNNRALWALSGAIIGAAVALLIAWFITRFQPQPQPQPKSIYTPIPVTPEEPAYPADAEEMVFNFTEPAGYRTAGILRDNAEVEPFKATRAYTGGNFSQVVHHGQPDDGIEVSAPVESTTKPGVWTFTAYNTAVRDQDTRLVFKVTSPGGSGYSGAAVVVIRAGNPRPRL